MNNYLLLSLFLFFLLSLCLILWVFARRDVARLKAQEGVLSAENMSLRLEINTQNERLRLTQDAHEAMSARFAVLSHEAAETLLKRAEENFVAREKMALERMSSALLPVRESLTRFEEKVGALEAERQKDSGGLKAQIEGLMTAQSQAKAVTEKLANALRRGAGTQGRWGEETLRNVLQAAGLSRFDFIEQVSISTDEGRFRPDVLVRLPGERGGEGVFVIDAKVNLSAFLEAMETPDEAAKEAHLLRHTNALKAHVKDLAAKAYWDQFHDRAPDFVAMFVPGDGFLAAALERSPDLLTEAMAKKVIIVTPTTLFALCKAVSYGWRAEDSMKNAAAVAEIGRELYARLSTLGGHVLGLGKSLNHAVEKYNDFVGSLETKVLTQARRFEELGVDHTGKEIGEPRPIDTAAREVRKLRHDGQ